MARKATGKAKRGAAKAAGKGAKRGTGDIRAATVDAALALAARQPWQDITLQQIAAKAKVPLADVVETFGSKLGVVRGLMRRIDRQVLDAVDPAMAEEPARERLFDIFISRLEVMTPHKPAIASMIEAIRSDPEAMLALNLSALRSVRRMMAGAGIDTDGLSGALRAQGLAIVFARVLDVWLDDDDPGMARSMAELDRRLRDGERMVQRMAGMARAAGLVRSVCAALLDLGRSRRAPAGGA